MIIRVGGEEMCIAINLLVTAITAWCVTTWVAKRHFDRIDCYVRETTQALKDAAERLGATAMCGRRYYQDETRGESGVVEGRAGDQGVLGGVQQGGR